MKLTNCVYWVGSGEFGLSHYKDCHVYLVQQGDQAVLIDSGCGIETDELVRNIKAVVPLNTVSHVFLTHGHADHSGGATELRRLTSCHIVASAEEKALVETGSEWDMGLTLAKNKGAYPQEYCFPQTRVDEVMDHGDRRDFGAFSLTAVKVPGHSLGGVCYLLKTPEGRALFSGDTVFTGGFVSLINCPGSELGLYRQYIDRLRGLDVDALFPGHGAWTLRDGQRHLNAAADHFTTSALPLMR